MSQLYCWIKSFSYLAWLSWNLLSKSKAREWDLQCYKWTTLKTNAFLKTCLCNFLCTTENNSVSVLLKKLKLPEDRFTVKGNCPSTHQMHCWSNSSEVRQQQTSNGWQILMYLSAILLLNTTGNVKKQLTLSCCCSECMASSDRWTLPWAVRTQLFIPACTC